MQRLPRLLHFLVNLTALNLAVFMLLRLAFWLWFRNPADPIPGGELLHGLWLGFKYDLRLTLLLLLPLFLLGGFRAFSPFTSPWRRNLWFAYLALVMATVLLFYFMNFGYFAYLHTPMDATVLRFAYNLETSLQMVWETYPVVWILLGLALVIAAYVALLHHLLWRAATYANPHLRGWRKALTVFVTFVLVVFGLYGKFSWYPLRWSEAFATPHAFAPAVAMNPILYFANTLKNREVRFDEQAVREHYPELARWLGVTHPDPQRLDFRRIVTTPGPLAAQRPNIVMVFLESFASYKTGLFGNPLNPTPNFDALARESVSFTRYYAPHTGTARSVWAAITGLPDVETHKTSSRNPLVVDQHTLVNAFTGYEKFYFLGGSANWGNIRGLLQHNIPGLHVYEEGSYESPRIDVWGISDLDLFREATAALSRSAKPFFAIIQTSGNHRPYTIPDDHGDFRLEHHDPAAYKRAGFISEKEYNSFRFMDYSVGAFMKLVRQQPWYANTIFVFYGDHGITGYGGEHTPAFESKFILTGHHTPLLFHAPALLPPRSDDRIASEVDLLPSLASLAAPAYVNTTLGRSLFDPRFDSDRYAFTITHSPIPEIGLLSKDFYFRMLENGQNKLLAHLDSTDATANVIERYPEVARRMESLTRGIFETARWMRYHNGRKRARAPLTTEK